MGQKNPIANPCRGLFPPPPPGATLAFLPPWLPRRYSPTGFVVSNRENAGTLFVPKFVRGNRIWVFRRVNRIILIPIPDSISPHTLSGRQNPYVPE